MKRIFECSDSQNLLQAHPPVSADPQPKVTQRHRAILGEQTSELFEAKRRLIEFSSQIGSIKVSSIRKDVLAHCNKVNLSLCQHLSYNKIEGMVKNRIDKMIKNKRIKKNWSEEDVMILIWIVSKYSDFKNIINIETDLTSQDWDFIAGLIPGVRGDSCMFKWLGLRKNNLADYNWCEKQSILLDKIVKKYGETDWTLISQKLYAANYLESRIYRCPKQCREHWNCYLNPKLKKGPWSKQEDLLLLNSVINNKGVKRWAELVKLFNGRTENALKNRFTLIVEKQMKNRPIEEKVTQIKLIEEYLERIYVEQFMAAKYQNSQQKFNIWEKPCPRLRSSAMNSTARHFLRSQSLLKEVKSTEQQEPHEKQQSRENVFIKSEEQQNYEPFIYLSKVNKAKAEEEISEPCQIMRSQVQMFEENDVCSEYPEPIHETKYDQPLPEIQNIKIVSLNEQMLKNLKANLLQDGYSGTWAYVPCTIMENKLTKLNYQF